MGTILSVLIELANSIPKQPYEFGLFNPFLSQGDGGMKKLCQKCQVERTQVFSEEHGESNLFCLTLRSVLRLLLEALVWNEVNPQG